MTFLRLPTALALGLAVALGGAALPIPASADLDVVDPARGFPSVDRAYSSLDAGYARPGAARSTARIRGIRLGSSKDRVVRAIGRPASAFRDGSWNYDLSLDYPQRHRLICQYRVYFDREGRVSETVWRRPQCAAVIRGAGG